MYRLTCKFCGGEVRMARYSSIFGQPGFYFGMCMGCKRTFEPDDNLSRAVKNVREGLEEREVTFRFGNEEDE